MANSVDPDQTAPIGAVCSGSTMANSVDPDQTAPIGEVCSGCTLFASLLNSSLMLAINAADDFSRRHFQMHFFLGALRVSEHGLVKIKVRYLCAFPLQAGTLWVVGCVVLSIFA